MTPDQRKTMDALVRDHAQKLVRASELKALADKEPTLENLIAHETAHTEYIEANAALRRFQGSFEGPPKSPGLRTAR